VTEARIATIDDAGQTVILMQWNGGRKAGQGIVILVWDPEEESSENDHAGVTAATTN